MKNSTAMRAQAIFAKPGEGVSTGSRMDTRLEAGEPRRMADADPAATLSVSANQEHVKTGRFRVLRSHAEGGLGRVFVAYDTEVGREVALKEIKAERSDDFDSRDRFTREAE